MKAMKSMKANKGKSMKAMKSMKSVKKKPASTARQTKKKPAPAAKPAWEPFVFTNSLNDGPEAEAIALCQRMVSTIFKYHARDKIYGYEEVTWLTHLMESGICLSLRDPPVPYAKPRDYPEFPYPPCGV